MFRFYVPKMACGGCVRGVTAAVRNIDPRAQVEPDLQAREVKVMTASRESAPLLQALKQAGFTAELRA